MEGTELNNCQQANRKDGRGNKFYRRIWLTELMIRRTLELNPTHSPSPSLSNETGALSLD